MQKLLVINGPNLNMLGIREPEIYGRQDYNALCRFITESAKARLFEAELFQSNHEGDIIDKIQSAYGTFDGIVINPGGFSHTSIAIADAIRAVGIPTVEVHLSDIYSREPYRRVTVTGDACQKIICGRGFDGYADAMDIIKEILCRE